MKNREIKFRIWDEVLMHMYTPEMEMGEPNLWSIPEAKGGILKKDDCILMQYTGLKDKEGKEIYEGDIIKWRDKGNIFDSEYEDCKSLIEFEYAQWYPNPINVKGLRGFHFQRYGEKEKYCEIIGNIYQNPELLEK